MGKSAGIVYYGSYPENRGIRQLRDVLERLECKSFVLARQTGRTDVSEAGVSYAMHGDGVGEKFRYLPGPVQPFWQNRILHWAVEHSLDFLMVRETPLSGACLAVGRQLGIPVYLDIRENLAAMYRAGEQRLLARLAKNSFFVKLLERRYVSQFDAIFSVSDELGDWVSRTYHIPEQKIHTLGNYPSRRSIELADAACASTRQDREQGLTLVHAGYVQRNRGLQDIVTAMRILNTEGRPLHLKILGEGDYLSALRTLVDQHDLNSQVQFVRAVPPDRIYSELVSGDVGVCSYLLNEQAHLTMPGKLFEYMTVGLPILTSARRPVVRIIGECENGLIYPSRNAEEIAKVLRYFLDHPDERIRMANNSRLAVRERFNEDRNVQVLGRIVMDE